MCSWKWIIHYTYFSKLNRYENAAYTKFLKEAIGVDKFIVIIAREDIEEIKNRYSGKKDIRYVYTDFYFSNLLREL